MLKHFGEATLASLQEAKKEATNLSSETFIALYQNILKEARLSSPLIACAYAPAQAPKPGAESKKLFNVFEESPSYKVAFLQARGKS